VADDGGAGSCLYTMLQSTIIGTIIRTCEAVALYSGSSCVL